MKSILLSIFILFTYVSADEPPTWTQFPGIIAVAKQQSTTSLVQAIDDDSDINNEINYSVDDPTGYVHIDSESGLITIDPINSDEPNGQITFNVTAYEAINPESYITGTILVLFYGNKM